MLAVFATLRAAPGRRDDLVHFHELDASREAFDVHAADAGEALADLPLLAGRPEPTFAHPIRAKGLDLG
ncbi:MAG: hypothetical protein AB1Z57_09060 [Acidimicrobiia bacterium]